MRPLAAILPLVVASFAVAQEPLKQLTAADYGKWESLGGATLSHQGAWLAYQVRRVDGKSDLRLRMLAADGEKKFAYGSRPTFSKDDKWFAFSIGVSEKQRERMEKAKKPVRTKLGLHSLVTGKTEKIADVQSFSFSEDGRYLAMRRFGPERRPSRPAGGDDAAPAKKKRTPQGVDLVVRDLATGIETNFGNVGSHAWTDQGALLAMTIDAEGKAGNGVRLYDPTASALRTLESGDAVYGSLRWREDGYDLAVFKTAEHGTDEDDTLEVMAWRGLNEWNPRRVAFDHLEDEKFPADMRVVDFAGLRWSDDGQRLFFGIAAWQDKPDLSKPDEDEDETESDEDESDDEDDGDEDRDGAAGGDPKKGEKDSGADRKGSRGKGDEPKALREKLDKPAGVEVWHARDIDIIPRQQRTLTQDQRRNHLCALWLDEGRFVQLGDEQTEEVRLLQKERRAVGLDNTPYETEKRFGPTLYDAYLIDLQSGDRRPFLKQVKYVFGSGPDGRYVFYVRGGHLWTYDGDTDRHTNLTEGVDAEFINREGNQLTDEPRPYGVGGWSEDGSRVFVHSRWDLWAFAPDGSAKERLTQGAADRIRHRLLRLDLDVRDHVDPTLPFYVSLYGDRTKKSGFARLHLGEPVQNLLFEDKSISRLTKAEDAEVYAYVQGAYDDSPDVFTTGADLDDPRQISATNTFQKEYHWGRSELVDYDNTRGEHLQGALYLPAGYEAGKQYPMIVYIYEMRSQGLHGYTTPSERSPYNTTVFTTQGYFVFQPDITYRAQNPGLSALECVVPAVRKVLERGDVDPERVGLVGHSWGAYQTAFLVTQTDVIAAGVAGAPLTNMMSMSMSIYWNSGQPDAWIFHESQGRMDRPFWRDVDTYIANSPIFHVEKMQPLLVAFGDEDGAVDFNQGVELYNAARLAQRPMVMLNYPGENHSLRKKENQVDYHWRVRQWFDHYLKGTEAPTWIADGQTWRDRKREIELFERQKKAKKKSSPKPKDTREKIYR